MSKASRRAERDYESGFGRGMSGLIYLMLAGGTGLLIKENWNTVSNVPLALQWSGAVIAAMSIGIFTVEYRAYRDPAIKRKERAGMVADAIMLMGGVTVTSLSTNLEDPFKADRGEKLKTMKEKITKPKDDSYGAQVVRSGNNIAITLPSFVTGYGCSVEGETFPHTARLGETTLSIISKAYPGEGSYSKEQKDAINDALIAANPSAHLHQIWADKDVFMVTCPHIGTSTTAAIEASTSANIALRSNLSFAYAS
jgi:hypothetical protein